VIISHRYDIYLVMLLIYLSLRFSILQGHEPTTIAMLIGLAATNIGNADPLLSKTICLHLPTLLQQSGTSLRGGHDLDVSPLIQTAALAGLGLLHCSTAQRLVVEFLIAEICSQSPSIFSSTATSGDARILDSKESTTLAAGWALGVVMLGRGGDSNAIKNTQHLADLRIEDRLYLCIEGGKRPPDSKLFSGGVRRFVKCFSPLIHYTDGLQCRPTFSQLQVQYIYTISSHYLILKL
jgi:hypothetical protein